MGILGSNKTVSIDFSSDEIKVVEGKYTKKCIVISKSFSVEIPSDLYVNGEIQDMDQLSYIFKQELAKNKISQADAYGIVNSSNIIMREVTMPKVAENQIESILSYQLEEYIPINPEDYVVKYITLGTIMDSGVEKLNLLLIGIPRNIVESHLNLLKNVNLKPTILDYQGNAINKLIYFGDTINNSYDNNDAIACIDLGLESTSLTITQDGVIKVSRVIEVGGNYMVDHIKNKIDDLSDQEILHKIFNIDNISKEIINITDDLKLVEGLKEGLNECLESIELIFRYYKTREIGNDVNLVLLHGPLSNINGIEKLFSAFFDINSISLTSLIKIKFDGELSKYANAIGGLIRLSEVQK